MTIPTDPSRRRFIAAAAGFAALPLLKAPALAQGAAGQVAVVGGGFAGALCARALKRAAPAVNVTLIVDQPVYTAAPMSDEVLAGVRSLRMQQVDYARLAAEGIAVTASAAQMINTRTRQIALANGASVAYDRAVIAPGIDFIWGQPQHYVESAAERMPHAWIAGDQTMLLRRQIEAMPDGGVIAIVVPPGTMRNPPGPYERASLIAYYLRTNKPHAKIRIFDAKDDFPMRLLFEEAWRQLYPGMIEWLRGSDGGRVIAVDPATGTIVTDKDRFRCNVVNVIPPQKAGAIADKAGLTDRSGWCPVDAVTFESKQESNVYVIGDAAAAGAMPKSAFAANLQAKICALAIAKQLAGEKPKSQLYMNATYSLVAPDFAFSSVGIYRPDKGKITEFRGTGGYSALKLSRTARAVEAVHAEGWYRNILTETFG